MRSLFFVACITFGTYTSSALADTTGFSRAATLAAEGKCDEAWDLIYPLVVSGNRDAAIVASALIIHTGLIPPGSPSDVISLYRHALILAMHGVNRKDIEMIKYTEGLLLTIFPDPSITGEILSCLKDNSDVSY